MNRTDMSQIAAEVVVLYGSAQPWSKATNESSQECAKLARHFAGYLPQRVLGAIKEHAYEHPERAPKPAEVISRLKAQRASTNSTLKDPNTCNHPQPWGWQYTDDGDRLAFCRYCYTEFVKGADELLTDLEIDELKLRRSEERMAAP